MSTTLHLYGLYTRLDELKGGHLSMYSTDPDELRQRAAAMLNDGQVVEVREITAQLTDQEWVTSGELPDGSGFATASWPLPKDHWLYAEGHDEEPQPFLIPPDSPLRKPVEQEVRKALEWAVRGATMNGQDMDFDPDALVQNALYALLGPFGKCTFVGMDPGKEGGDYTVESVIDTMGPDEDTDGRTVETIVEWMVQSEDTVVFRSHNDVVAALRTYSHCPPDNRYLLALTANDEGLMFSGETAERLRELADCYNMAVLLKRDPELTWHLTYQNYTANIVDLTPHLTAATDE